MQNSVCADNRVRGMFQFYGAGRSGRWAGRITQFQNLPAPHMTDLTETRDIVKSGDYEFMNILYDDVPDALSQLIRTAFIPKPGYKFCVADFSAIEARVIAFLAKENWRMKVFKDNGDIYCASASAMFHVPVEKHGVNRHLRQKGKIAELALGYGGSVGALTAMGALDMGLTEDELQPLVDSWRASNPNIVQFWWDVDRCVKTAIKQRTATETHGIRFIYQSGMLFIALPSGRRLCYVKPKIGENRFGGESVTYEGVGTNKKWERIESYGPKFVENIVQAISRDILCYAMRTLSHCFIVGHVHDELIIETPMDADLTAICEQMGRTPAWIEGLLLRADGYETAFYKRTNIKVTVSVTVRNLTKNNPDGSCYHRGILHYLLLSSLSASSDITSSLRPLSVLLEIPSSSATDCCDSLFATIFTRRIFSSVSSFNASCKASTTILYATSSEISFSSSGSYPVSRRAS